jgi:hypothetical protein
MHRYGYGLRVFLTTIAGLLLPCVAQAQGVASSTPEVHTQPAQPPAGPVQGGQPPASTIDQPADKPQLRAFCTDRPTKSNGACTVDEGHFQIETDVFNASFAHLDGVNTDTYLYTNPTLKYGLTNTIDVQANWTPYETVRTHDTRSGAVDTVSGVGDLYLRGKVNLFGEGGGSFDAALFPYVKAPTARTGIGDGAWEGGLVVPVVFKLSDSVSLTFDPEVDFLENTNGGGLHPNMAQLADISWTIKTVTLFGEVWSNVNFDPTGTVTQYSTDFSVAWGLSHDIQLDAGVNFGLNRVTPAVQVYTGLSHRF